jgi:hypothetical protein
VTLQIRCPRERAAAESQFDELAAIETVRLALGRSRRRALGA